MSDPYTVQVVIDCTRPHLLADWWAEVLGWQVEPQDEHFITSMVEQGLATEPETTRHRGRLVWATGAAILHPHGTGVAPRILFQRVTEGKTVKNRVHLDLRGDRSESADELARLVGLGATELWRGRQGPHAWVTLTDPEGNEFCLPTPTP